MLIYCDNICRDLMDVSLDLDTNEAVCKSCGEVVTNVTHFTKLSMKLNKDIIKTNKKGAFVFRCKVHDQMTEVHYVKSRLKGKSCPEDEDCLIDVTESMKNAIKHYGDKFND